MNPSQPVTVGRIEDPAAFETLREEWDELLSASASNCLFLTWEWLYTWWKHLSNGRRLHLITVRCGEELAAIAPLAVRPQKLRLLFPFRSLEFLGTGSVGSDYLDIIVRRGKEAAAVRAVADHLVVGNLMLELASIKRESCLAAALSAELLERGWSRSEERFTVCPFIDVSRHSWQSYLATLGREHRHNFKRRLRHLTEKFDVRFEHAVSEEERGEALACLLALHNVRWEERGGSNALSTPTLGSFHEELSQLALKRGWLRLFVLRLDGRPAASLYGFMYNRTFYFYQQGFHPDYAKHSPGLVMTGLTIRGAIEEGAAEYDFLRGDEEFKFRWTRQTRELGRVVLYPPRARGFLCKTALRLSRTTRKMARRVLGDALADRIAT